MAKLELIHDALAPIHEWEKGGGGGKMKQKDIQNLIDLQTQANRVNQQTPLGSLTFSGNTATTTLSPEQQRLLEQTQIAQLLGGQLGTDRLAGLGSSGDATQQAVFDRALGLLSPQLQRHEEALRQRLANQGLPQSSGAFTSELGRFETARNQALENLALSSVMAGSQEQTAELNRILGMLGLGQPAQPQFINVPQVQVPFQQPGQGSAGPLPGILGLAGLAAGPLTGTGLAGSQLGFTAGSNLPGLFGG